MVSRSPEQFQTETQERIPTSSSVVPTVMYLIEIDSNVNPCLNGDGLPLQMLNINHNNAHYLIPIQGSDQSEIQHNIDLQKTINETDIQNIFREEQVASTPDIQSYEKAVEKYVHMADSVPPPRALASLPGALRVCRGGVSSHKLLPPRIRFGPVRGVVREVSKELAQKLISEAADSEKPIFLLSKKDTISHIDVSDKDKSNWFSLLPLGDESSANVWLYQEGDELYALTTRSVAPRARLRLGYSRRYARRLRLPAAAPVCGLDDEDEQRKWWCYECRFSCKSAALLQRHMDETHVEGKTNTRRRRYRCKNCALPFSRLFTLKRHMSLHCKSKTLKPDPPPQPETTPDTFLNTTSAEEERLPSDESFQNYTNSLDFSTNLFDTDRLSTLDISANSRSDLNFYGEKDDSYLPDQSVSIGNLVENAPSELDHVKTDNLKEANATNVITCPHCQDTISITLKQRHMRECGARALSCACGRAFRSRARLARHVRADHAPAAGGRTVPASDLGVDTDSSNSNQFKCDECRLNFKRRGMFVNHMWRAHGAAVRAPLRREQRHYPCVACPKLYRSAAKRRHHVRTHHPEAELARAQTIASGAVWCAAAACPACPRQYATRAKMLQHVRDKHPHLQVPPPSKSHK